MKQTFLDHHLEQLLDEERIPSGRGHDPGAHVLRDVSAAEYVLDHAPDSLSESGSSERHTPWDVARPSSSLSSRSGLAG